MDCRLESNRVSCNCSYEPCPRKGICCQCLDYHRRHGELPACFFSRAAEKSYDRTVANFLCDRQGADRK